MKNDNGFTQAFGDDDESLAIFLRAMGKFDKHFCNMMAGGLRYTLRMELQGDKGMMIHCRVSVDEFERPKEVDGQRRNVNLGKSQKRGLP